MRLITAGLIVLAILVHYGLWFSDQSVHHVWRLSKDSEAIALEVEELERRNQLLRAEAQSLNDGLDAIEERARSDLGLIKPDETFYQVIESDQKLSLFGRS